MTTKNFEDIVKGTSFGGRGITIQNQDGAIDLTDAEIRCQFRKKVKTGALAKDISVGSGITLIDAVNGVFEIDDFVCDFEADLYWYDVQFTFPDGRIKTYFGGYVKILQDVTTNT